MREQSHREPHTDLEQLISSIFDATPVSAQPTVLVQVGCGDGRLLRDIHRWIHDDCVRGRVLDEHGLTFIGVEADDGLVEVATRRLAGLPARVVAMDLDASGRFLASLEARIEADARQALFIHSACPLGHADAEAHGDLFAAWRRVVGPHGLILHRGPVQARAAEPWGSSAETLMAHTASAGLLPRWLLEGNESVPTPWSADTLYLQKADYRIRPARASDLPALLQLEAACWAAPLRATSEQLSRRLTGHPEGQLVLELLHADEPELVGAIYSQRIRSAAQLRSAARRPAPR